MKKALKILLSLTLVTFYCNVYSQTTNAKIEKVDFTVDNNKIITTFNITNFNTVETYKVDLKFITDESLVIKPVTVTGDIGHYINGGDNKSITWDVLKDRDELTGKIKAVVSIISVFNTKYQYLGAGPGCMFLSVLIPGFGDYLVRKNTEKSIPYFLIPISVYGIFTYSVIALGVSKVYEGLYDKSTIDTKQSEIDMNYNNANKWYRRSQITNRFAFTIWGADVVWVFFKGIRNNHIRKKYNLTSENSLYKNCYIYYNPVTNGIQFAYVVNF
ncbi:MAG: hypothetical protein HY738_11790 [Bacteroidia bacterium]|nr:hypothetical protein [Bacteroidia bacterium]